MTKKIMFACVVLLLGLICALWWLFPTNKVSSVKQGQQNVIQAQTHAQAHIHSQQTERESITKPYHSTNNAPKQQTKQTDIKTIHAQPKTTPVTHDVKTKQQNNNHTINIETGLPFDKNDPVILAKRRHIFEDLTSISVDMGKGKAPSTAEVKLIVADMKKLVKQGYLLPNDAQAQFDFLQRLFPDIKLADIAASE